MKNLFAGIKKVKSLEVAEKEFAKSTEQVRGLEQQQAETQERMDKLTKALELFENFLVVSEDKATLTKKAEAEKQIVELNKAVEKISSELAKAQEKRSDAEEAYLHARGTKARGEAIESRSKQVAVKVVNDTLERFDSQMLRSDEPVSLAQAFGFGDERQLNSNSPQFAYISELATEVNQEGEQKGREIAVEALEAFVGVLRKYGIEFNDDAVNLFEHAGVEIK